MARVRAVLLATVAALCAFIVAPQQLPSLHPSRPHLQVAYAYAGVLNTTVVTSIVEGSHSAA